MHEQLMADNLLHGIEVVNSRTFSEASLAIALEYGLTIMGTSDVHGLIDWDYGDHPNTHRPVTLIFAKERSPESVKEALFAGRTAVWYHNSLIGKARWVKALLQQCLTVQKGKYVVKSTVLEMELQNHGDAELQLRNVGELRFCLLYTSPSPRDRG